MKIEDCNQRILVLLRHTTIHGISHVYNANNRPCKLIWLLFFFLGFGGLIFNLVLIIQRYLLNPITISHIHNHEPFIWPDLTFCNPTAPFSLDQSTDAHIHWKETLFKTKEYAKMLGTKSRLFRLIQEYNTSDFELEEISITLSTIDPGRLNVDHFHNHVWFYGYTKQHSGIYLFKEFGNGIIEVESKELTKFFTTQFVQIRNNIPCYTFQINRSKTLDIKSLNSLIFVMRFNYPSYKIINSSYIFRSIFLYVNNKDQMPQKDGILMLPGFNNELTLSHTRYNYNPQKTSCRKEIYRVELYDASFSSTKVYEGDYEDCKKVASQKIYFNRCQCYNPFLPIFKGTDDFPKLCLNASIYPISELLKNAECMLHAYEQYHLQDSFDYIEETECNKYKKIKCEELKYKTDQKKEMWIELWSNSFNDRRKNFIQETYQPLFKRHWQGRNYVEEMRNDVAMLVIKRSSGFGDLYIEEFQYPLIEFISNIGGLMSLWMGLSVISLFEIMEFIYLLLLKFNVFQSRTIESDPSDSGIRKSIEIVDSGEPINDTFIFKPSAIQGCYDKRYCISSDNHPKLLNGYLFPLDENELGRPNRCMHSIISSF